MRILMVVPEAFYAARGTPLSASQRARELADLGHDVEILTYGVGGEPPEGFPALVHRAAGPHLARSIRPGPSLLKVWFDVLLARTWMSRLSRRSYDLVWAHEEAAYMASFLAVRAGLPYVYDMHSSLPHQLEAWDFSRSRTVRRVFEHVERRSVRRAAAVVAIGPALAEIATDAGARGPVTVLPNVYTPDPSEADPEPGRIRAELGVESGDRLVVYAGSFVPLQNLELAVRALPHVLEHASSARLLMVGGSADRIAGLEALARELGVGERIALHGPRPRRDVPSILAAAEVLISPRVEGINPPGKLFEYLAAHRPIVAVDRPVHTQILDGESSVLVEPDPEAFGRAVGRVLEDDAEARRLVEGAAAALRNRFGAEGRDELYRRVLEPCAAGAGCGGA